MKTRRLICNDCGCRFEIKDGKESITQTARPSKTDASASKSKSVSVSCPESGCLVTLELPLCLLILAPGQDGLNRCGHCR